MACNDLASFHARAGNTETVPLEKLHGVSLNENQAAARPRATDGPRRPSLTLDAMDSEHGGDEHGFEFD